METIIKSKTNNGEYAKQYFFISSGIIAEMYEPTLIIRKLVLSKDVDLYRGFKIIKCFKDSYLFETTFSIKLSTLKSLNLVKIFAIPDVMPLFNKGDKITLNTGYICDTGIFIRYKGSKVVWQNDGREYKSDIYKYNITLV